MIQTRTEVEQSVGESLRRLLLPIGNTYAGVPYTQSDFPLSLRDLQPDWLPESVPYSADLVDAVLEMSSDIYGVQKVADAIALIRVGASHTWSRDPASNATDAIARKICGNIITAIMDNDLNDELTKFPYDTHPRPVISVSSGCRMIQPLKTAITISEVAATSRAARDSKTEIKKLYHLGVNVAGDARVYRAPTQFSSPPSGLTYSVNKGITTQSHMIKSLQGRASMFMDDAKFTSLLVTKIQAGDFQIYKPPIEFAHGHSMDRQTVYVKFDDYFVTAVVSILGPPASCGLKLITILSENNAEYTPTGLFNDLQSLRPAIIHPWLGISRDVMLDPDSGDIMMSNATNSVRQSGIDERVINNVTNGSGVSLSGRVVSYFISLIGKHLVDVTSMTPGRLFKFVANLFTHAIVGNALSIPQPLDGWDFTPGMVQYPMAPVDVAFRKFLLKLSFSMCYCCQSVRTNQLIIQGNKNSTLRDIVPPQMHAITVYMQPNPMIAGVMAAFLGAVHNKEAHAMFITHIKMSTAFLAGERDTVAARAFLTAYVAQTTQFRDSLYCWSDSLTYTKVGDTVTYHMATMRSFERASPNRDPVKITRDAADTPFTVDDMILAVASDFLLQRRIGAETFDQTLIRLGKWDHATWGFVIARCGDSISFGLPVWDAIPSDSLRVHTYTAKFQSTSIIACEAANALTNLGTSVKQVRTADAFMYVTQNQGRFRIYS